MASLRTTVLLFSLLSATLAAPTSGASFEFVQEGDRHRLVRPAGGRLAVRDPAIQDAPSGGYAPVKTACPATATVRRPSASGPLNAGEAAYVKNKAAKSVPGWQAYLTNSGLNVDQTTFFKKAKASGGVAGSTLPNLGIAVSGGGLRALLVGAGILNGLDARNPAANQAKVGGLAELANYGAGLSGGAWMVTSAATSNFPTFPDLNQTVWDLTENIALPRAQYPDEYAKAAADVAAKAAAGYEVSLVDLYGRILSYHLINDTTKHGAATLYDSIRDVSNFKNNYAPYPIVISTSRNAGQSQILLTNPIYESSPHEFGTWDPSLNGGAFVPIDYMGTAMTGGKPASGAQCTVGFDNAGFVFGASSDIFGELGNTVVSGIVGNNPAVTALLDLIPDQYADDALVPNSFQGLAAGYAANAQSDLFLADGGFLENVPFWPLQQPARKLDAIIAIDGSADSNNYPNGTAPYTTYLKSQLPAWSAYKNFPKIPQAYPTSDFTARGLNKRPVFFGCDPKVSPFIIIYLPNYLITDPTNTSTFQLQYSAAEINGFFRNGFAIATQTTGSGVNATWAGCLACAVIDRQLTRNGQARPAQCQSCFNTYCA